MRIPILNFELVKHSKAMLSYRDNGLNTFYNRLKNNQQKEFVLQKFVIIKFIIQFILHCFHKILSSYMFRLKYSCSYRFKSKLNIFNSNRYIINYIDTLI